MISDHFIMILHNRQKTQQEREILSSYTRSLNSSLNKQGKLLSSIDDQLNRWKEYFQEVLNRPKPLNPPDSNIGTTLDINMEEKAREEIWKALNQMNTGKAAGIDNIPPEVLKEGEIEIVNQHHKLFNKIWETEIPPAEWEKRPIIIKIPKIGDLSQYEKWR